MSCEMPAHVLPASCKADLLGGYTFAHGYTFADVQEERNLVDILLLTFSRITLRGKMFLLATKMKQEHYECYESCLSLCMSHVSLYNKDEAGTL